MATVTGKNATVYIYASGGTGAIADKGVNTWGISDFSLTFDRGTVEQELVGQTGNYYDQGALSIEGSITNCKFAASGNADMLINMIETSTYPNLRISGSIGGTGALSWYFLSTQATSYEVTVGDADTISEMSIDFQVLDPHRVSYSAGHITDKA